MLFFFSSRRRHTRSLCDWSSDVCSSDLIEGMPAGLSRVKTISLGGAYLESPQKLSVGDSIKLEVRAGLRKINFTAVVRNIGPDGSGIEFVHMRDEDREKLRKLVQRHLQLHFIL